MEHLLSAVIITLNEERNIGRCIDALQEIADEIIVLDSFSTDQTVAICEKKGVKIVQRKWEGYAATKNYLNQLAANEYVFSVDADEVPDKTLIEAIKREKKKGLNGIYQVNRLTNYCGKWIRHSSWYPDVKIRVFSRFTSQWEGEYVHEELTVEKNQPHHLLKGHLNHYSYYSHKEHRERADKYSLLTAQKLVENGKKASFLKPYLSAVGRFITMYIIKLGFLDGSAGFHIARISALSNIYKYKTVRRLTHENN